MTAVAERTERVTRDQVQAERLSRSLRAYIAAAWTMVESREFVAGWHIDAICEHLEAVTAGEIRQLLINVPPRHMKSLAVSVFWPTWSWTRRPEQQWLCASYASNLSTRDALKSRRLIESGWYQRRWGHLFGLAGDANLKTRYENDRGGYRLATSVGGSATGEGADVIVVDDPHKAEEATSDTIRQGVLDWHDQTLSTRFNDPKTGCEVVIMQRLHEADLTGHLLDKGGWEHLCLPAEYEPSHPFCWPDDPRVDAGELLWPDRFGESELAKLKTDLGSYGTAGQLQQRPAPAEGGILKRGWWQWYGELDDLPKLDAVAQSWDTAWKDKQTSDFVVGQVWGRKGANRYLLRKVRARMDVVETKREIRSLAAWVAETFQGFDIHPVYVPLTDVGPDIVSDLRRTVPGVIGVPTRSDKVQRANAVAPQLEAGQVHLPGWDERSAPAFAQDLVNECAAFPNAAHDDDVDAFTQAMLRMAAPAGAADTQTRPQRQHSAGVRDKTF